MSSSFPSPQASTSLEEGPMAKSIRQKLTSLLNPSDLSITNDSWQHRHHAAMKVQGGGSGETPSIRTYDIPPPDFSINVVSEEFQGKTTMQRHRLIYSVLSEELSQGLHALSLKTKTPDELQKAGAA